MITIIHPADRNYRPHPNRTDGFRLLTDTFRQMHDINPQYLTFDLRTLPPCQYNAAYHFHRYADEMFVIFSGAATLRTPDGLQEVAAGDIIFFGAGETGAHQLYNHTAEPCEYLDLRTSIGHDVCEYPDSDKLILMPQADSLNRHPQPAYFDGEENVDEIWNRLRAKQEAKAANRKSTELEEQI